ncbi:MAG: phosphatidate cytidylyltransferase [Clostridiales bacterium]|nr:phosphatidate cytidylyltransferase [Clostridiales bacterium]
MALSKKSLLNRVLVGIAIFIVMLGMILLNVFLPNYTNSETDIFVSGRAINSVIISALILLSVVEMRRALGKERIPDCFSWLLWLYGIGIMPVYSLFGFMGIMFFSLIVFIVAVVTAMFRNRADSLIYIAFMLVYPGLFMATLLYINRSAATRSFVDTSMYQYLENDIWTYLNALFHTGRESSSLLPLNAIGLALVFAVSTFTDVFAYFVGSLFGKHKLCPEISPKKTVEGAIGGVFGGVLGSALVFFVFDFWHFFGYGAQFGLTFDGLGLSTLNTVLTYTLIGLLGSVATQIGDLLASLIKRYCGIKDYSRLLGEHGGIIDRFDGIMFNSVFVSFMFMFIL